MDGRPWASGTRRRQASGEGRSCGATVPPHLAAPPPPTETSCPRRQCLPCGSRAAPPREDVVAGGPRPRAPREALVLATHGAGAGARATPCRGAPSPDPGLGREEEPGRPPEDGRGGASSPGWHLIAASWLSRGGLREKQRAGEWMCGV